MNELFTLRGRLFNSSKGMHVLKRAGSHRCGLMIIYEVFKNFAKFLESFFDPSNAELKTVQCTVKRLNLRKLSEITNFQKNIANYQLPPPPN